MKNISSNIYNRILQFNSDNVFIANDFFDIGNYETVRKVLNRLTAQGKIRRILKGIYYNPKYIDIIQEYEAPSINKTAFAIARKYNWTIAPSGNTALNLLGLSTQVPAKWTYISDGRYVSFSLNNNIIIEFKYRSNKEISNMSTLTSMIIQAIKTIGKDKITDEEIEYLQKKLSDKDKKNILEESKTTSVWVYSIIQKICEVK